ncbi:MAG TPA: mechanosensitive ion channel family protein [Steroidobacteraceae bacterium]|nr:mechanosensitive ion channel family protein [Burkholderiales bacterium]HSC08360.1 mechanosensitive ion channel family protein [Steroidobacteraceae bacterium]
MADETTAGYLDGRIDALREHVIALVAAVPALPAQFARVGEQLAQDWQARPPGYVAGLILGFLLLGFAVEAAYRRWVAVPAIADGRSGERACSIGLRFARELGALAVFAVGSAALFLAFDWPARTRTAVVAFLATFIALRALIVASRALLSPRDARLRILPATDAEARFWHLRIGLFSGWFAFGWVVVSWLALLGMDLASRQIVAYMLGLGLLGIAIEAFWRRTRLSAPYFVVLWLLWAAQAWGMFWLAVVAGTLPLALRLVQAAANNTFSGIPAAVVGRTLRAALIIGAAFLLVRAFGLDVDALAAGDTFWTRLLRGAVHALAIVLVADVLWMISAALIDRQLASVPSSTEEGNRAARLRTLLPIVRSTIAAALIVMVVLTALSALGIEVGPLLAGAGVVGVAVGFGAQTLVRDLFSKFFYLLDDAFRVGEYIESGNYKGTVEHLGARSIRLRHHRGPVFTIPYGQLGAVKNSSRDWVIDKMMIGVVYGSDLDKVKKIIKDIGKKLAADPEFGPKILEPLKMQGVEQFSDFAIQIRMKMKTQPNEQFGIRRRAYAMINEAFAANGIKFAHPTVQVAGPADAATAAAARQALELKKVS